MCAAISAPLSAALAMMGVPTTIQETVVGDYNHVFLQLGDGRVLDPTADQFNGTERSDLPAVYLGSVTAIHAESKDYLGESWNEVLQELGKLAPRTSAQEVGSVVRMILATLPAGIVELPS